MIVARLICTLLAAISGGGMVLLLIHGLLTLTGLDSAPLNWPFVDGFLWGIVGYPIGQWATDYVLPKDRP